MINVSHPNTSTRDFASMTLEGKILVDSDTIGNPARVGVYIPALMPTVDISGGALEQDAQISADRFMSTDKSATIDSSVTGTNYVIASIMQPHNQEAAWLQEGEHVFIGFIDNDIKKPFVLPWGGVSNVKHRMRDKLTFYVSNKKTVSGAITEENLHKIELNGETSSLKIHMVNSEDEPIGFDVEVDLANKIWNLGDTAGNKINVTADPDSPDDNEILIENAAGTKHSLLGKTMLLEAEESVNIKTAALTLEGTDTVAIIGSDITEESDTHSILPSQSLTIDTMDVNIAASMGFNLSAMMMALIADTTADILASAMMTVGVNPSCILFSPATQMNSAPVVLVNACIGPGVIPGAGGPVPPPPPPAPSGGGGGGGGAAGDTSSAPPKGAPPAHTQPDSNVGTAAQSDLAGGSGQPLAIASQVYMTLTNMLEMISSMAMADIVPPVSGGPGSMGVSMACKMAGKTLLPAMEQLATSKQVKG